MAGQPLDFLLGSRLGRGHGLVEHRIDNLPRGFLGRDAGAHAADIALGIPGSRDWDDDLTRARAALNWEKHFELAFDTDTARAFHDEDLDVDTDFCAMCGHDWCSVRISKEIQEFASGNAEGFERIGADGKMGAPVKSAALNEEQQHILEQRGYLTPEEVHALADKTRNVMAGADGEKAEQPDAPSCHSDYVDADDAKKLQGDQLVQINTAPAHNIATEDRII